ncbi:MAG: MOSC domain-containing protein [Cyanobacteria bacterium J06621_11]
MASLNPSLKHPSLKLSGLFIYPIKSAAGIQINRATLTPRGLEGDRRYMVVTPDGHFMTQRRFPKMALIQVSLLNATDLKLSALGMPELRVSIPGKAEGELDVEVWGDRTSAVSCGSEADAWFSHFLKAPCQLVHMPDSSKRPIDHGKLGANEIVSFADAYPYLLLSEASLAGLNQKLSDQQLAPVSMNRFRPNLVISGELAPHAEDDWQRIRIGEVTFTVAKPCARCSVPNVNQETGDRTKEPSRTLATYRAWDKEIWFGQNLIQETSDPQNLIANIGVLNVGDEVEILA